MSAGRRGRPPHVRPRGWAAIADCCSGSHVERGSRRLGSRSRSRSRSDEPLFSGSALVVEVRQSGSLAGRRLAVQLGVDGASIGRFETTGDVTLLRAESLRLTAGVHEIVVKSGSVRATAAIRVWPGWSPWAAGALLLAIVGLGLARALHRRRAQGALA